MSGQSLKKKTMDQQEIDSQIRSEKRSSNLIRDFIVECGVSGKLIKSRSIEEQLLSIEQEIKERYERWKKQNNGIIRSLNQKNIIRLSELRKKLIREDAYSWGSLILTATGESNNGLTREQIDRAKTFPIESIIDVKNGMAKCVSGTHEDKNPSMDVRNGFAYCYTCGFSGDAINVAMKVYGVKFKEAVERLQ